MPAQSKQPEIVVRITIPLLAIVLCFWFGACGNGAGSPAHILSLTVAPNPYQLAVGNKGQVKATGKFSDGSERDLTSIVYWQIEGSDIASINYSGLVTPITAGKGSLRAQYGSLTVTAQLTVTPAPLISLEIAPPITSVPLGNTAQLTARGHYADGSTSDLTSRVSWTSGNNGVALMTAAGQITPRSVGATSVSATLGNVSGSGSVSVTPARLVGIGITANTTTLPRGGRTQLLAVGNYTDGSQQDVTSTAQWSSSAPAIVAISNTGVVAANSTGTATVVAALGTVSGSSTISVGPATLVNVSITPQYASILVGQTQQMLATGTYTDGSTLDLTARASWSSTNAEAVPVSSGGLAVAIDVATTQLTASYQGLESSATVVTQPTLAVSHFSMPGNGIDTNLRILYPGSASNKVCAMIYVFDQSQQLSECCGCGISRDALLSLSYSRDLLANPLTGVQSSAGTVVVVSADQATNPTCDASVVTPSGTLATWSGSLEAAGRQTFVTIESLGSKVPLASTDLANLQAQCSFIGVLGSGRGACSCGSQPSQGPWKP